MVKKIKDVTLVSLNQNQSIIIACDSCGGIGMKKYDQLKTSSAIMAKYTVRVAVLEVLCTGAEVVCLVNTICNEMNPTGLDVLRGIREELLAAELPEATLTGSTEENFATFATGVGITAIGVAENECIKINTITKNALLIALGTPKVGQEVLDSKAKELLDYKTVRKLAKSEDVYELLPVGSKGILYEAEQLAGNNNLGLSIYDKIKVDLKKSAGPSTVILAAVNESFLSNWQFACSVEIIGELDINKKEVIYDKNYTNKTWSNYLE